MSEAEQKAAELFEKYATDFYGRKWMHEAKFREALAEYGQWLRKKWKPETPSPYDLSQRP